MLKLIRHCERSEAIHLCYKWIATSLTLLAMTVLISFSSYAKDEVSVEPSKNLSDIIEELSLIVIKVGVSLSFLAVLRVVENSSLYSLINWIISTLTLFLTYRNSAFLPLFCKLFSRSRWRFFLSIKDRFGWLLGSWIFACSIFNISVVICLNWLQKIIRKGLKTNSAF